MNKKFEIDLYRNILNKQGKPEKYEKNFVEHELKIFDINNFIIIDPELKIKSQFQPYNDNRWINIQLIDKYDLKLKRKTTCTTNSVIKGSLASYINAEEIENIHPKQLPKLKWQPNEQLENLILSKNMPIYYNSKTSFFDNIFLGVIHLPPRDKFLSAEKFYKTAYYELTNSTFPIFNKSNANESIQGKIIAELTSLAIVNSFGYSNHDESSIYYINYYKNLPEYKEMFEKNKELILKHTEKAYNFILSSEQINLTDQVDLKHYKTLKNKNK